MRLIDADSLKENLSKWLKQVDPTHPSDIPPMEDIIVSTIMTIEEEPTVDAVPVRHGMWLPKHHYIAGYEFVSGHICSECGDDALNAEGDDFLTDYCPNCGAKMDDTERKEE